MKYLIIGAGGTGGSIGAFMAVAGYDVTAIARGKHLQAIREHGLKMETTSRGHFTVMPMKACEMDDYNEQPDVIFVCVKGYSLEDTIPFIHRISHKDTVVIPLLNIYGTGGRMQQRLPEILVTDGCIYIAAEIKEPGTVEQKGDIFRVVFGTRDPIEYRPVLERVAGDLQNSRITGILSENIQRDALIKFSVVSPMAACGAYYDSNAGAVQRGGPIRATYAGLVREIDALARAMNIDFNLDIVENNLQLMDGLLPTATASMQRDLQQGKQSEIDGLIFEVVRLGQRHHVPVPIYSMIAEKFGFKC